MSKISGIAVFYATSGGILLWSGIKGQTIKETIAAITSSNSSALSQAGSETVGTPQIGITPPQQGATGDLPAGTPVFSGSPSGGTGGSPSQNQALAKLMAGSQHPDWVKGQQWQDWLALWNRESGWSQTADTRKTGLDPSDASVFAYGIPQARPYTKMPKAGWPPDKGGKSDAAAQISWGIQYIAETYGSPSAAEAHEQSKGWY